jgi:glycogen debranching enzyme
VVIVATAEGTGALAAAWRTLAPAPGTREGGAAAGTGDGTTAEASLSAIAAALARRDASRQAATPRVATPVPDYDVAWEWAKARLASFMVHVPRVGTGLVAGYAASRPGWGDARPGYAWFFGRDACWCGDALLAAGMFDEARAAMEFLAATADVTGKIAHEVTTSGVAHYDAADATPLWLRFVAQYADWTGDHGTVRALWDAVRAAFAFVLTHDRDGDGLPENTGVGHGWVESGPLGGGAVTSYVAAIWIDALRRLAPLARTMGDADLARRAERAAARATAAFEARLRDPRTGMVALQLDANGHPSMDLTALSAVPILLGVDAGPAADTVMAQLASDEFSAPWGVRMIGRRDARYRPRGYHFGAVWPLYTGWAALAAFARARTDEGWQHLSAVASCAFARERGAFDEVLDGDTGAAAGICPDQAWSAAMVISPFLYGMFGLRPSAAERRCIIDPSLPRAWDTARVSGLRVGASRFSIAVTRDGGPGDDGGYRCEAWLEEGPSITLQLGAGGDAVTSTLAPGRPMTLARPVARRRDDGKR